MPATLTTFDAALKDFYEGAVRDTLNNDVPAFKHLDETSKEWSGRSVRFPVRVGRNFGVGGRAENATLPGAGNQQFQLSITTSTYQYARVQISGPTLEAGKNAFISAMDDELQGAMRDLVNDLSRQSWGYGDGRLCRVNFTATAAGATAIGVDNRFTAPGHPGGRFLYQNQRIGAGTVASPTADFASAVVSNVVIATNAATLFDTVEASAGGLSANSAALTFLFNMGAGGAGVELNGLQALVDDFSATNIFSTTGFRGSTIETDRRFCGQRRQ